MATSFVAADNLLSAGIVLPNPAGNSLPSLLQDRTNDKRRKRVRPSSPLQLKIQEVVRPQPHFLVMSRVYDGETLKCASPFILERVINGAAKSEISIRKLQDGTAIIQTLNDVQTVNVMGITEIPLSNSPHLQVKMEPHRFLNVCKGVVTCYDLVCLGIEELCAVKLKKSSTEHEGTLPQPKRPRTAEDFLLFCQYILDYVNYDETKTEEVVVEKTENSIGDDDSSPNSVKSESAISSATEDDRKSSDTDSGKNYSDIDTGHKFGWLHPFLSKGAHAGFIHAGMRTSDFITLSAIRSIATAIATTSILMKAHMIWSHVTVQSHLLADP
uniref:(California timema) hypothetical protein n=1 Tax=Timema californicum TaxID=61474 RepID=A0A7R9PC79_TIMCA|nr:unnamed protein product [Timema californicum]